jgi:RNA polymerase sigma-70 factor (ECF subfamily)
MPAAADLDALTTALQPRVRALARHLCGAHAADGVQQALLEVARSWPTFRGESEPTTWAHRVAVRALARFAQRQRAQREREPAAGELTESLADAAVAEFAANPFTRLAAAERRERVHAAIAALSPPLREVLVLRAIEGLDYAAIADALELPLGTVKSRIAAATLRLAERLQGLQEER